MIIQKQYIAFLQYKQTFNTSKDMKDMWFII